MESLINGYTFTFKNQHYEEEGSEDAKRREGSW
jgi:hypothetical protein